MAGYSAVFTDSAMFKAFFEILEFLPPPFRENEGIFKNIH
jgi:hypothetical protein